jgi:hypothetical protein
MNCNHCGYPHATAGKNCPSCGKVVVDPMANFVILIGIIVLLSLIIGPLIMLYKGIKAETFKKRNLWLTGAVLASLLAIYLGGLMFDENSRNGFESTMSPIVFWINVIALSTSLVIFVMRLKNNQFNFLGLFKDE